MTSKRRTPKSTRRRGRPSRENAIDWLAIERLYVQGEDKPRADGSGVDRIFPGYSDLAARFGLEYSSVANRGRKGAWPEQRTAYEAEVRRETQRKTVETLSSRLATLNEQALETNALLIKEVRYALSRKQALRGDPPPGYVPSLPPTGGAPEEFDPHPLPSRDAKDYAVALKTARAEASAILGVILPTAAPADAPAPTAPRGAADRSEREEFSDAVLLAAARVMLDGNQAPKAHGQGEATPPAS